MRLPLAMMVPYMALKVDAAATHWCNSTNRANSYGLNNWEAMRGFVTASFRILKPSLSTGKVTFI
jgi:hypothetical protein